LVSFLFAIARERFEAWVGWPEMVVAAVFAIARERFEAWVGWPEMVVAPCVSGVSI
jgi:hypothetical protein